MEIAHEIAQALLQIQAFKVNAVVPYRWSSGWLSPVYTDNRLTLYYPAVRQLIKQGFERLAHQHFAGCEVVAGVATAGIPHGVLLAEALGLPFIYVRPEVKQHGTGQQLEGRVEEGKRVLVVEDLISTGGSSAKAINALQAAGLQVLGLVAIFQYGFPQAATVLQGLPLFTLTDFATLLQTAQQLGQLTTEQLSAVAAWQRQPALWMQPTN